MKKTHIREIDIENRVDELLSFVELEDKKYSYPSELSGGQKQRPGGRLYRYQKANESRTCQVQ